MSENLRARLVDHLRAHALRTDGPFTLRSGATSSWYLDARQTTFDGTGALLVGELVLSEIPREATAVGGMTMGADPIAVATAIAAAQRGRPLRAFSIRKQEKDHGTGGRLVGPVRSGEAAVLCDDTVTTGGALAEAVEVARSAGLQVVEALALVDRSDGEAAARMESLGVSYRGVLSPGDLGVE